MVNGWPERDKSRTVEIIDIENEGSVCEYYTKFPVGISHGVGGYFATESQVLICGGRSSHFTKKCYTLSTGKVMF